jgi:predicted nucleic acid-binding protein
MRVLDSDVIIDILRGYPPAVVWLAQTVGKEELKLPGFVVLELIAGCKNKQAVQQVMKLTKRFSIYWPPPDHCAQAIDYFATSHLSHNIGVLDMLIGASALSLNVPLCTFNVKHFKAIPGLTVEQPYQRTKPLQ